MELITTRQLEQLTGLYDWQIWRLVRHQQLKPIVLANRQFIWTPDEVQKALGIAAQMKARKECAYRPINNT